MIVSRLVMKKLLNRHQAEDKPHSLTYYEINVGPERGLVSTYAIILFVGFYLPCYQLFFNSFSYKIMLYINELGAVMRESVFNKFMITLIIIIHNHSSGYFDVYKSTCAPLQDFPPTDCLRTSEIDTN